LAVAEALQDVDRLTRSGIAPLLNSVEDAVEAIIATVHNEDFSGDTADAGAGCSPYMRELQGFVSRVAADFLRDFEPRALVAAAAAPVAVRTVERFVVQASLVRPLGNGGRQRLAADCLELERSLEPLYLDDGPAPELIPSLNALRALKSLLPLAPEDVATSTLVGRELPASIALHLLFAWAPKELRGPHESADWSLSRYTRWLNEHPAESQRLALIQGALEGYVAATRARGEKAYAYPYPVMLQLLQKIQNVQAS